MAIDYDNTHTKVTNTSGAAAHFGFIPPHGKTLAADEVVYVLGNIWARVRNIRSLNSLAHAINWGYVDLELPTNPDTTPSSDAPGEGEPLY